MGLNELQQAVVNEIKNNVLLVASAGTGKTSTLACRIANIINSGKAKPEEILCLTFTNRACLEIKDKVMEELEQQGMAKAALKITVKTFHSFCCDIVRLTAKRTSDIFNDFVVFDDEDCQTLITATFNSSDAAVMLKNFIKQVKINIGLLDLYSENKYKNYQEAINYIYQHEQKFLANCFQNYPDLKKRCQNDGAKLLAVYDRRLNEAHGLDFEDLIIYANKALRDSDIVKIWRDKFKFIHIDEVQDTSKLEYKIISKIFSNNKLLLCGDPFQTIYEWRGSDPKLIEEQFKRDYQPKVITFNENYRATQTLLNASYAYLKNAFQSKVKEIYTDDVKVASPEVGKKIALHTSNDFREEAQWIFDQIQQIKVHVKAEDNKICVLTRSNGYNDNLAEAFEDINRSSKQKIPFMLIGEFYFFRRQEIKDVLAFMKFAVNKHDGMSLERVIKRFVSGIGETTIDNINANSIRETGVRLTDFMDPSTHKFGDPFEELLQALESKNIVVFDVESTGLDTTDDEIIQIAAIRLNADGSIKDKFIRYLKPTKSVGRSVNVHGLTDEFLSSNGQEPHQALKEFVEFAKDSVLVGHNVNYDLSILSSQMNRLSMSPMTYKNYYDTLDIFRRFYPRLENHKLESLGEFCEVKHKSTHDAYDDICATAEILIYAIKRNILPTLEQRRHFIFKYLKKFEPAMLKMQTVRQKVHILYPKDLINLIISTFDIVGYYDQKESHRLDYIKDLCKLVEEVEDLTCSPFDSTQKILQYSTLSTTEMFLRYKSKIPIITINQAKGMEFDFVFVAGLMENKFPSYPAILFNTVSEDSRLFYVAITRAKKELFLSYHINGFTKDKEPCKYLMSRFIKGIPANYIQQI